MKKLLIISILAILVGGGCQNWPPKDVYPFNKTEEVSTTKVRDCDSLSVVATTTCGNGETKIIYEHKWYWDEFFQDCMASPIMRMDFSACDSSNRSDPVCTHTKNLTPTEKGTMALDEYTDQTCVNKNGKWTAL